MLTLVLFLTVLCPWETAVGNKGRHERKLNTDITEGFISIDCGCRVKEYNETNLGSLLFKSDEDSEFIDTGIAQQIDSEYDINDRRARYLRSFPNGTRNCYTLYPKAGKDNKYLIRATFKYGNYDGLNKPPVFDLYLGTDRWTEIKPSSPGKYYYHEIIHVASTDYIDVCLVKTEDGVPFISALELRHLDNEIYPTQIGSLRLVSRWNIGALKNETSVRYPDDIYDRFWEPIHKPEDFSTWQPFSISPVTKSKLDNVIDPYKLPPAVLGSAVQTSNSSVHLTYEHPQDSSSQFVVYFHFAEFEKSHRKVEIILDRNLLKTVELEYLKPVTIISDPFTQTQVSFSINAAEYSDLPPILNGLETFEVKVSKGLSTAINDVSAFRDIKKKYNVKRDSWQGDPCLPIEYKWEGVECNNNVSPQITSLNMSSSNLTGMIDEPFGKLKALESLDLSNNDLNGPVPEFLADLPNLKQLNLAHNNLSKPFPKALQEKMEKGNLKLSLMGNPSLCEKEVCQIIVSKKRHVSRKSFITPVVSTVSVLAFLILVAGLAYFWRITRKKQGVSTKMSTKRRQLVSKSKVFSYSEILTITNNFSTIIGEGGFGKVYQGVLEDGTQVAVKILSPSSKQGYNEFQAEAQLLLIVHHRKLVSLVGYCDDDETKALIYEYMANGNLEQHLSVSNPNVLNWHKRLQIAVDAAQGLEYLHNGCKPAIVHRDIKPSNILLDDKMQAKIADFGLSRIFKAETESHESTQLMGTMGYLDPEYQTTGKLNKKSDVYSFGIILLQLITGQPAIIRRSSDNINIYHWIRPFIDRGDIRKIVDRRLQGEFNLNSAWKAVEIAISCIPSTAIQRPDMNNILAELKECLDIETTVPEETSVEVSFMSNSAEISSVSAR